MRNDISESPSARTLASILSVLLLILALIPSACSESNQFTQTSADKPATTDLNNPKTIAGRFITACLARDWSTALDLLVPDTREAVLGWSGGNPCSQVPVDADSTSDATTERAGNTIYVTFEWPTQESDVTVEYRLLLTEENGAWLIFDDHKSRRRPTPLPVTPAPTIVPPDIVLPRATGSGE
jgi:hypothetical protein